jgi:hypothetical protein
MNQLPERYIVKCNNKEETNIAARFIKGTNTLDNYWLHYEYVIQHLGLLGSAYNDSNMYCEIPYQVAHLPIIEFEEFKKHIRKPMEKKIIGYKLIRPEYKEAALHICRIMEFSKCAHWDFTINSINSETLKKAGVLDIWFEPVYEPEKPKEKVVSMGNFNLTVKPEGIFHKSEDITDFVRDMTSFSIQHNFGKYKAYIKDITFKTTGCENSETTLSQWINVWNEYQKIRKL